MRKSLQLTRDSFWCQIVVKVGFKICCDIHCNQLTVNEKRLGVGLLRMLRERFESKYVQLSLKSWSPSPNIKYPNAKCWAFSSARVSNKYLVFYIKSQIKAIGGNGRYISPRFIGIKAKCEVQTKPHGREAYKE